MGMAAFRSSRPARLLPGPEDAAICESVHRGLKSLGYRRGRFVATADHASISEINVHAFQRQYAEAMGL